MRKESALKLQKGFTLIELLVVIGILAILMGIVLVAINPSRQFAQANDTKRRNDVSQILSAIHQYAADHSGTLPAGIPIVPAAALDIASTTSANLCSSLMPTYISALPQDPNANSGAGITSCGSYDSNYQVQQDANGRITVSAPQTQIGSVITVTR